MKFPFINNTHKRTPDEWHELVDRYFEAETTAQEEKELKRFLLTRTGRQPAFDEIRSVISYIAYHKPIRQEMRSSFRPSAPVFRQWAAMGLILISCGIAGLRYLVYRQQNYQIAYVYGKKLTQSDEVMKQMHLVMKDMCEDMEEVSVESELKKVLGND